MLRRNGSTPLYPLPPSLHQSAISCFGPTLSSTSQLLPVLGQPPPRSNPERLDDFVSHDFVSHDFVSHDLVSHDLVLAPSPSTEIRDRPNGSALGARIRGCASPTARLNAPHLLTNLKHPSPCTGNPGAIAWDKRANQQTKSRTARCAEGAEGKTHTTPF